MKPIVIANPWSELKRYTPARIALGRSGISLPTSAQLAFQLAHAQARDAVHHAFDVEAVVQAFATLGLESVCLRSAAADRHTYLQRPDLGRRLDADSVAALAPRRTSGERADLALVVADGLSALAVERHAAPFVAALLIELSARLSGDEAAWAIAPVAVVQQGRVAIGDQIGQALGADLVLVLIGERPGLSSPDSLGLYLTWAPQPGRSDAERNCISNVRSEGLSYNEAARRAASLMRAARARRLTGVALKDESAPALPTAAAGSNFLLG